MTNDSPLYQLAKELFPICRSLTGDGVRQTLQILTKTLPTLTIHEVPTGTTCFDWKIPDEWNIRDAYVIDPDGKKIIDFKKNNLHVVNYSIPVDCELELEELQNHLYSLPEQPDAIPYRTSYYQPSFGFCMHHAERLRLKKGRYKLKIDSTLKPGSLTYGELLIPGSCKDEILLSTYICHPSMANNEVSGVVVQSFLAHWLLSLPKRYYSYRVVFVPETIGAIAYIAKNLNILRQRIKAGYVITCVGDDNQFSFMPSRLGGTLADKVALHVLKHRAPNFKSYNFHERGSDERQYCSPGVELPVASIMRSKYATYPEYHTSLDNLDFISAAGLEGSFELYKDCIELLERNKVYQVTTPCEPQLGKRGLYPTLSSGSVEEEFMLRLDFLAYADGKHSLLDIAERVNVPAWRFYEMAEIFKEYKLVIEAI